MDNINFEKWLIETKKMKVRSARDVLCRLNRVADLVGKENVDSNTLNALNVSIKSKAFSYSIKSQLRRAVKLYLEFLG